MRANRMQSTRSFGVALLAVLAWLLPSFANAAIVHAGTFTNHSTVDGSVHYVTTHTRNRVLSSEDADYTQRAYLDNTAGGAGSHAPSRGGTVAP